MCGALPVYLRCSSWACCTATLCVSFVEWSPAPPPVVATVAGMWTPQHPQLLVCTVVVPWLVVQYPPSPSLSCTHPTSAATTPTLQTLCGRRSCYCVAVSGIRWLSTTTGIPPPPPTPPPPPLVGG
uniref:Secreted protein n=1 Tax=Lygus hesperus TaxID=30085 RepID=A0A0A9ZA61_LYGHE